MSKGKTPWYKRHWLIVAKDFSSILPFKSLASLTVTSSATALSNPIEEGSFASYNKVIKPIEIKASLTFSGEWYEQMGALVALRRLHNRASTVIFITPNSVYFNFTVTEYKYTRSQGDSFQTMKVDLTLLEIRQVNTTIYSEEEAANASSVSNQSQGWLSPIDWFPLIRLDNIF